MSFRIGVLASTNGTDLQAIMDEMSAGKMPGIELAVVAGNVENCGALEKARAFGAKAVFVNPAGKSREEFDAELVKVLGDLDLICLIGYMRILSPVFVRAYEGKIINVHPALMPKYGGPGFYGTNVHEAVLNAGEKETGMTIHFVTEGVDEGPILIQKKVAIETGDTAESLKEKVQALEKKWYPEAIRLISEGKIDKIPA